MPSRERYSHGGWLGTAAIEGRIVVLAGRDTTTFRLTTNEIYHPEDDRWEGGAPVPTGRSGVAVTALDDWVYLFGGETLTPERCTFAAAERYHLAEDRWERLPAMPTAWMRRRLRGPSTSSPAARRPVSPFPTSTSG